MEKKFVKTELFGRMTGMGARTHNQIYSISQEKKLEPAYSDGSKTGNHWSDYYYLFPANYILAQRKISNRGNHRCFVAVIKITAEGSYEIVKSFQSEEIPSFVKLPCECLRIK